jgi:hypothetical protein
VRTDGGVLPLCTSGLLGDHPLGVEQEIISCYLCRIKYLSH